MLLRGGCLSRLFSLSIWDGREALADQVGTIFNEFPVLFFEGCEEVAVDIEFSHYFSANENGDYNLRLGFVRTCQIAIVFADVVHHHGLSRRGRRSADSLV